jgi:Rieske Fe-S protein
VENAQEVFEMCCTHYGCNLSWEEATKLAGWC